MLGYLTMILYIGKCEKRRENLACLQLQRATNTNIFKTTYSICHQYIYLNVHNSGGCWVTSGTEINWTCDLCFADLWYVQDSYLRASWLQRSDAGVQWRCEQPARPLAPPGCPLCPCAGRCLGLLRAPQLPWTPVPAGEGRVPPLHRVGSHEPQCGVPPPCPWLLDGFSINLCFTLLFFAHLIKTCAQYICLSMLHFLISHVYKC